MATSGIQWVTPVETAPPVVQDPHSWSYVASSGKAKKKKQPRREHRCTIGSQQDLTSRYQIHLALAHDSKPVIIVDSATENWLRFQSLAEQWRNERGARSSITEAAGMPAYQKIIGMGAPAIPLLLAQLKSEGNEPDQWFWALRAITDANPVKPEDQGNFRKMAKAWLQWGEEVHACVW